MERLVRRLVRQGGGARGDGARGAREQKFISAGEHLQRAGVYYHFGKFLFVHDVPQMKAAHMKAVACRNLALPHIDPPGEHVTIPYEGKALYGILRKPKGVAKPPLLIMAVGLDSAKEETDAYEQPYLARGIATLVFDGPGQGEGEYDFAIRGDYEVAVKAVVDYVMTRNDVDTARIGLWGVSLGGYYAPRAAAFEKRHQGLHLARRPVRLAGDLAGPAELTREAFRVRSHCATQDEAKRTRRDPVDEGRGAEHHCPIFVMTGKLDRLVPWQHAERLASEVKGPCTFLLIEDGNHVANNRAYRWRAQSADWLAEQLLGAK